MSEPSRRALFATLARRQDNPAEVARCRIDYADYADRLPDERQRTILAALAAGSLKMEIGKQIGVSGARVGQLVHGMADIYVETFGLPGFEVRARKVGKRRGLRQARNGNGKGSRPTTPQTHTLSAQDVQAVSSHRKRRR